MSSKIHRNGRRTTSRKDTVEALHLQLLKNFYEADDREQAEQIASRLERALKARADYAGSIRKEEIRSLIAELRGVLSRRLEAGRLRFERFWNCTRSL